jgi:hypothetical protein
LVLIQSIWWMCWHCSASFWPSQGKNACFAEFYWGFVNNSKNDFADLLIVIFVWYTFHILVKEVWIFALLLRHGQFIKYHCPFISFDTNYPVQLLWASVNGLNEPGIKLVYSVIKMSLLSCPWIWQLLQDISEDAGFLFDTAAMLRETV